MAHRPVAGWLPRLHESGSANQHGSCPPDWCRGRRLGQGQRGHTRRGGALPEVDRADLDGLREAADEARRQDSRYGGGNGRATSVTAELSRLGWTAFDVGRHDAARRPFVRALRLARAGRDVQLGCYVLTTMAMQALLSGSVCEAVGMAQGAFERAKGQAAPRVLAFTKLIEARAHARGSHPRAAARALAASEDLFGKAEARAHEEPSWIDFYHHARLSADAGEIYRDLNTPRPALAWNAGRSHPMAP